MNKSDKKELIRNLKYVVTTGIITVLVTNIAGLMLTMYLAYDAYAEYKIYTTYITFAGIFHFGLTNGVYLKYGKFSYEEIPKEKFRTITTVLVVCQLITSAVIAMLVQCIDVQYKTSYLFVLLNVPLVNVNCYFSLVNQFTKRFKRDSIIQGIQAVLWVMFILGLVFGTETNSMMVMVQITIINICTLICHLTINRNIVFGHRDSMKKTLPDILEFIKEGKNVMLSEFVSIMLINLDLIFVQHLFDTYNFAIYAFAASIINAVYALMMHVNGICYPYLVRETDTQKINERLHSVMLDIGVLFLSTYYILEVLLKYFFEKYVESIPIIKILYITILMKMIIIGVYNNVCKVQKKNNIFLYINIAVVIVSAILNLVAYKVVGTIEGMGIASVVSTTIWLIVIEKIIRINISAMITWIRLIAAIAIFFALECNFVVSIIVYVLVNVGLKLVLNYINKMMNHGEVKN